jgi:hypothetical protein
MLARIFAETGMRQLYELILHLLVENQSQPRTVRLRNEWVEMDPASWHADLDVRINVALGAGGTEERLKLLDLITSHQKMLLDEGSPLVDLAQYRKGLARMVELAGFPSADEFYKPFGPQEQQQHDQMRQQQPPPPDPQMQAIQMQMQIEQAKLELDRQEMIMKDARERAKMEMEFAIKQATAEAQYGAQISNQEMQADVTAAKAIIDAAAREAAVKHQGGVGGPSRQSPANGAGGGGAAPA